mgnify:CR=1 FL=1
MKCCTTRGSNKHGNKCHGKAFTSQGANVGSGVSSYYRCSRCETEVVFNYWRCPGILVWVIVPEASVSWDVANEFLREIQKFRDGLVTELPVVPKLIKAHTLQEGQWTLLP